MSAYSNDPSDTGMTKKKCVCGSEILLKNMSVHVQTKKHISFLAPKSEKTEKPEKKKKIEYLREDPPEVHGPRDEESEDEEDGDDDGDDDGIDIIISMIEKLAEHNELQHNELMDRFDEVLDALGVSESEEVNHQKQSEPPSEKPVSLSEAKPESPLEKPVLRREKKRAL